MSVEVRLPAQIPEARVAHDLAVALGQAARARFPEARAVLVAVHRNRSTLLRWRSAPGRLELHVHQTFLPHPADVLAVVDDRDPDAWLRLKQLDRGGHALPQLRAEGHVHDLDALLALERARLDRPVDTAISWGRFGAAPSRSLRLGSCLVGPPPLVRVHPVLDHDTVPDWFVGFVVYHELLHLRFPPFVEAGRRVVHPRSFRQAERRHPCYPEATAWEKAEIGALIARARQRG